MAGHPIKLVDIVQLLVPLHCIVSEFDAIMWFHGESMENLTIFR